jgi:hypothetical protein
MSDRDDINNASAVVDRVDHTVVTDPDSPVVLAPLELPAASRARLGCEGLDA